MFDSFWKKSLVLVEGAGIFLESGLGDRDDAVEDEDDSSDRLDKRDF